MSEIREGLHALRLGTATVQGSAPALPQPSTAEQPPTSTRHDAGDNKRSASVSLSYEPRFERSAIVHEAGSMAGEGETEGNQDAALLHRKVQGLEAQMAVTQAEYSRVLRRLGQVCRNSTA